MRIKGLLALGAGAVALAWTAQAEAAYTLHLTGTVDPTSAGSAFTSSTFDLDFYFASPTGNTALGGVTGAIGGVAFNTSIAQSTSPDNGRGLAINVFLEAVTQDYKLNINFANVAMPFFYTSPPPQSFFDGASSFGLITSVPGGQRLANLSLTTVRSTIVPEPAPWVMMILGFGAIGASMRRWSRPALTISYQR